MQRHAAEGVVTGLGAHEQIQSLLKLEVCT